MPLTSLCNLEIVDTHKKALKRGAHALLYTALINYGPLMSSISPRKINELSLVPPLMGRSSYINKCEWLSSQDRQGGTDRID